MNAHSAENETSAWALIARKADQWLKEYPNTFVEDLKILKDDDKDHTLTVNQRNIVLYRKGEKMALNYLKLVYARVQDLLGCSNAKKAKKQLVEWEDDDDFEDYNGYHDYMKNTVIGLLKKN